MHMECPFCTIDQERTRVVKLTERVAVILSNPRLMPGHLLVVPLRHVEKMSELSPEERTELLDTAIEFQEKIVNKLSSGCDIRQHYHPFRPQGRLKVNHVHIHLQPRDLKDQMYQRVQIHETDVFQDLSSEETTKIITLLS